MNLLEQPFFILSAERYTLSVRDNILRTKDMRQLLKDSGYTFKEVMGRFGGTDEASFIVFSNSSVVVQNRDQLALLGIAREFQQDAILKVNADRTVEQLATDPAVDTPMFLGVWTKVSKDAASKLNAYTYDPTSNTYWIAG